MYTIKGHEYLHMGYELQKDYSTSPRFTSDKNETLLHKTSKEVVNLYIFLIFTATNGI